jgi:hypothetical protein
MKSRRSVVSVLVILLTATAFAQTDAQKSFEKLKALSGTWEGSAENRPVQVSFRLTSHGSALMSEIQGDEDMISMFHLDGDHLMMTHYCAVGNQPRMIGTMSPDGKTMTFTFVDATNLISSQPGHMQQLVVTMIDDNHHTEDWAFLAADGKTQHHALFDLRRKQ